MKMWERRVVTLLFLTMSAGSGAGLSPALAQPASVCPNVPLYESGIPGDDRGTAIPFQGLLKAAFKNADLLFMGDTAGAHMSLAIPRFLAKPEFMSLQAENDVGHFFIEMPNSLQRFADDLAAGKSDRKEFVRNMLDAGYYAFAEDTTMEILQLTADTILTASQKNIKVHFADFDNGKNEYFAFMDATEKAQNLQTDEAWNAVDIAEREFNEARLDDRNLATFVNKTMQDGKKGVLFYGATHGLRVNDFEEFLHIPSLRLDLYSDNQAFYIMKESLRRDPLTEALQIGKDKPALVYMLDAGKYYTTCNTPPSLLKALEEGDKTAAKPPSGLAL